MRNDEAKRIADTLGQTQRKTVSKSPLPPPAAKGALPGKTGVGRSGAASLPATGAIAGPLVEKDASLRQYHPETNMTTSDGLFVIRVQPIKRVTLTDAKGQQVVMEYAAP
ncbi:hypothetical protein B0T40_04615 [Chromobacterium haemolyticum]|uniref:hypothetical protein n=1 Tax=Chromobacterium haemolyticum TaxID=394935 RepID=UPI0009DA83A0|nr:hypothetical protein [Chromobacterium haemolyticum]OQS39069.1 hypothetical protein B0T40_04615 [Chromobacterium haemolyticum]